MATRKEVAVVENLPGKLGENMAMAKVLSKSGIIPGAYAGRPDAVFAVIQYGREFGIPPMTALQNMAFINGKPTMGTDLLMALIHRHKEFAGYSVKTLTDEKCEVEIRRKREDGKVDTFTGSFSMKEAQAAGLVRAGGPWEKWKRRMMKHRACSFAARDAFPDIIGGTYGHEEMEPDKFAANQDIEMRKLDEVEAAFLEDGGPIVEAPKEEPKIAPKKRTPTSTPARSTVKKSR